ncbi:MAG: hypothetical protein O7D91_17115 [Planctomycetota bacterium]|nr:hypothetical protein [Planctomycetota bacterium]
MSRLDQESEVIQLADELGVEWRVQPVQNIIRFCLKKIGKWVGEAGSVTTIADLERLVCQKLRLVFEEIWTDADLDQIVRKYVPLGEAVFATLKNEFDEETFATLVQRRNASQKAPDLYVAIIDCRGPKASRRFFTRWHEIAHLLTLTRQLQFHFHRSKNDRCPIEKLMDVIAGEVGFYDPIFAPALKTEARTRKRLSFDGVEAIRSRFCSHASLQATLFAAVGRFPTPVIYVEVGLGYKKHERALLRSSQLDLFPSPPPVAKLRVLQVTPNDAARGCGFRIDRNMRVPTGSILSKQFSSSEGVESLDDWCHSDGTSVGTGLIHVEARSQHERVVALIQPVRQ